MVEQMNDDIIMKVYRRTAIAGLLIIGFMFFLFKNPKPIALGYLFGILISILSFKLLESTINRAVTMTPKGARSYTIKHYMIRSVIYLIVLMISIVADYLNFPATVLGLLMVKFTIVVSNIIDKDFTK
ncbi:MAG: ATP synthase subunit I [Tissierella sp.]|uniref:ATP synthase subunit I n=1 Tax=Tissierella sp. TaxID=41274 RepID=UPI003F949441